MIINIIMWITTQPEVLQGEAPRICEADTIEMRANASQIACSSYKVKREHGQHKHECTNKGILKPFVSVNCSKGTKRGPNDHNPKTILAAQFQKEPCLAFYLFTVKS